MAQLDQYICSYSLIKKFSDLLMDQEIALPVNVIGDAVAFILGYKSYEELLSDKGFNNQNFSHVEYIIKDYNQIAQHIENIDVSPIELSEDDQNCFSDTMTEFFEYKNIHFVDLEELKEILSDKADESALELLENDVITGETANYNGYYEEIYIEAGRIEHDSGNIRLSITGDASGSHNKDEGMPVPSIHFWGYITMKPFLGNNCYSDWEFEIEGVANEFNMEDMKNSNVDSSE